MLTRLKFWLRRWLLPKIDQGMTDLELYRLVRDLTGPHTFFIWRKTSRHGHSDGSLSEPELEVDITVFEHGSIRVSASGATNGEAWTALQLKLMDESLRHSAPDPALVGA